MRTTRLSRVPLPWVASAVLAMTACGGEEPLREYRVHEIGSALAQFPEDVMALDVEPKLTQAGPMEVTADGERILVFDLATSRLLILDRDLRLVHETGHRGPGPGEFMLPTAMVEDGADGFWVLDGGKGTLIRISEQGEALHEVRPTGLPTAPGVSGSGGLFMLGSAPDVLLTAVDSVGNVRPVANDPNQVPEPLTRSMESRLGSIGVDLVPGGRNEILLVFGRRIEDAGVWALGMNPERTAVSSVERWPLPRWLEEALEAAELRRDPTVEGSRVTFLGGRRVDGEVWLTCAIGGAILASLPRDPGKESIVVMHPAARDDWEGGLVQPVMDAVVRGDRITLVYPDRLVVHELVPTDGPFEPIWLR